MVHPPGFVTLPVGIFALTDRGEVFGAAATMLLILAPLLVLILLSRITTRAAARRAVPQGVRRHPGCLSSGRSATAKVNGD
jgi:hypothetical protein